MTKTEPTLFRILFYQEDKRYELYARNIIINDAMMGFVGIENLVFSQSENGIIDPAEEQLKAEFGDVKSFYISYRDIIRMDEVKTKGETKITELKKEEGGKVLCPPAFGRILTPQFSRDD